MDRQSKFDIPSELVEKYTVEHFNNESLNTKPSVITVVGQNSGMAIELDLGIIADISGWFVQSAPSEQRTLQNVTRVIHLKDYIESLIKEEMAAGAEYIEKRALDSMAKGVLGESDFDQRT